MLYDFQVKQMKSLDKYPNFVLLNNMLNNSGIFIYPFHNRKRLWTYHLSNNLFMPVSEIYLKRNDFKKDNFIEFFEDLIISGIKNTDKDTSKLSKEIYGFLKPMYRKIKINKLLNT